ncbi:MAG: OB-fold nucleic acid binding domain-containing protein, partial [Acidimicrobiia bacterium]
LASFHAEDDFMPRQLTKRGHRLVFSNGIIFLSGTAIVVLIVTGAKVDRLIPLYAIGVFTSFTLSQAGMAKHHLTHREPHWVYGLIVNGIGAALSFLVLVIVGITKFTHGAWVIIVLVPVLVAALARLNRQYEAEAEELERDAPAAASAPTLRRHAVIVLVDRLDAAAARAIQYARALHPDDLRAVHFDLDPVKTAHLIDAWQHLGFSRLPLDVVECPDRRIARAATHLVSDSLEDGDTEVSVLVPRVLYKHAWHRMLHDRTSDKITEALSGMPHSNVTIVPYHLGTSRVSAVVDGLSDAEVDVSTNGNGRRGAGASAPPSTVVTRAPLPLVDGAVPISDVRLRQRVRVAGRVHSVRIQPHGGVASLECTLVDDTGGIVLIFLGRRSVTGLGVGSLLVADGTVGEDRNRLAILNPIYEFSREAHVH